MLLRAAALWIGVNVGILALLAAVDLVLLVRRGFRRAPRKAAQGSNDTGEPEASVA